MLRFITFALLITYSLYKNKKKKKNFEYKFGKLYHIGKLENKNMPFNIIAELFISINIYLGLILGYYSEDNSLMLFSTSFGLIVYSMFSVYDLVKNWGKVFVYENGIVFNNKEIDTESMTNYYENHEGKSIIELKNKKIVFSIIEDTPDSKKDEILNYKNKAYAKRKKYFDWIFN